jgi:glycogen synthase kinase 3 beta
LVSKLLEYTPEARLSAVEAMIHPFFDELRVEGAKMPNGKDFPPLFDFSREGKHRDSHIPAPILNKPIELSVRPDLNRQLVPAYVEPELASRGINLDNFVPIPLDQMRITLD